MSWEFGSGFPKSHDVSKAIDKVAGAQGAFGDFKTERHSTWGKGYGTGKHEGYARAWTDDAEAVDRNARQYLPATADAERWQGWGTALKPAHEPIVLARKPLIGTVAKNVLAHGTGALHVDACRIGDGGGTAGATVGPQGAVYGDGLNGAYGVAVPGLGRWPANVLLDPEAALLLGEPCRFFYVAKASSKERNAGLDGFEAKWAPTMGGGIGMKPHDEDIAEPKRNVHPTVKPVALMRWLVRLVTPPGGIVLDPFLGSGTTGIAAQLEGFRFVGIEREADYVEIAQARLAWWAEHPEMVLPRAPALVPGQLQLVTP